MYAWFLSVRLMFILKLSEPESDFTISYAEPVNEIEFPEIEEREDDTSEHFNLTDYSWQGSDMSILTFEGNSRFVWQKDNQNILEGKYQI